MRGIHDQISIHTQRIVSSADEDNLLPVHHTAN